MQPTDWAVLLDKYGVGTIGLIVLGTALYFVFRWLSVKVDAMFNMIMAVKQIVPDPAQESVEKVTRLNKTIKGLMREVQLDFKADWIHFWQFHNGSRAIGKCRIPFMYISLTHELISEGCTPIQDEFIQLLLSKIDNLMFILIDNPLLIEKADPTGFSDNPVTARLYQVGALVQDILPVKDSSGDIVGVFSLSWKVPPELTEARKSNLIDYAHRLGIILSTYNENET